MIMKPALNYLKSLLPLIIFCCLIEIYRVYQRETFVAAPEDVAQTTAFAEFYAREICHRSLKLMLDSPIQVADNNDVITILYDLTSEIHAAETCRLYYLYWEYCPCKNIHFSNVYFDNSQQ